MTIREKDDTFIKITNKDIYNKLIEIEKKVAGTAFAAKIAILISVIAISAAFGFKVL